jgi:predicted DNA-binding protein YlxM (UPF0122 family)
MKHHKASRQTIKLSIKRSQAQIERYLEDLTLHPESQELIRWLIQQEENTLKTLQRLLWAK